MGQICAGLFRGISGSCCSSYALTTEQKNDKQPIVLHTLPKPPDSSKTPNNSLSPSLLTAPRLISVAEIIKREYIKELDKKRSSRLVGLHQYNEIGSLEESLVSGETTEEQRTQMIAMALEGKNLYAVRPCVLIRNLNHIPSPKQRQSPYMRITLSFCELPELVAKGAT